MEADFGVELGSGLELDKGLWIKTTVVRHSRAVNRDGSRPRPEPEWSAQALGDRHRRLPAIKESEVDKRATAGSNPAGTNRSGRQDLRSPPLRRNPIARSLRVLRSKVKPSGKLYRRRAQQDRRAWLAC